MTAHTQKKSKQTELLWFRIGYTAFVMLSIYYLIFSKDLSSAASNLGIALIFDPFDQQIKWSDRPGWQKIWLLVHLCFLVLLFGIMLFK